MLPFCAVHVTFLQQGKCVSLWDMLLYLDVQSARKDSSPVSFVI